MLFNIKMKRKNVVTNYEGANAYAMTPAIELYAAVAATALNDSFYEKDNKRVERIRELIAKNDAGFVAKMALYAREKMYLRSVPLVLAVELAKKHSGDNMVSKTVERIVQRADEITELLAYYEMANSRKGAKKLNKLSKQIQKGLSASFNKFDEYQFAKYNREAAVKLKDALFMVHPKAKDEAQQIIFNKIVRDELAVPYTWETELSAAGQVKYENDGQKKAAFKAKWEELVASNKMGYMAMLRNLKNVLEANVSAETIAKVCAYISNANAVVKSKQLPFRFVSAYRELKNVNSGFTSQLSDALEDAVNASASNIKGFENNTKVVIAIDFSGSMQTPISKLSKIQLYEVGLILAMLLKSKCKNVITGIFGEHYRKIQVPSKSILANVDSFASRIGEVGHSTNGYLVIKDLIDKREIVDKVMLFTDMQLWNSGLFNTSIATLWKQYKHVAPNAKIYLFDLAGYGQSPLSVQGNDVFMVAGWSDKVFDVLHAIENGGNAVDEIIKTEL
ncbi:MAG TPA: TROVE domain-containing protein [Bacteroidia bacterium]|nr:TROVE domain-containing protein [Bacteroidia bacterium]HNU32411.1 TROVE domain-containing protein [Bacteroidia bacterium]